jgi:hypothetical protein
MTRPAPILLKNSIGAHLTGWRAPARVGKRLNLLEHWSARNAKVDILKSNYELKSNSEFFNSIGPIAVIAEDSRSAEPSTRFENSSTDSCWRALAGEESDLL